ncbi:MAG: hypothetical protein WB624_24050 [Xanthobacteraceae bacterium]
MRKRLGDHAALLNGGEAIRSSASVMDGDYDAYAFDMDDCGVDRDGGDGGRSFRRFGEAPVHKAPAGFLRLASQSFA